MNDATPRPLPAPDEATTERQAQLCRLILSNPTVIHALPELQSFHFLHDALGTLFGAMRVVKERDGTLSWETVYRELTCWSIDPLHDHQYERLEAALQQWRAWRGGATPDTVPDMPTACRLAADLQRQIRADWQAYTDLVAPLQDAAPKTAVSKDTALEGLLQDITWEWPGYIPRGFLTMLVAEQEAGKSNFAQALCDLKLRGAQWPDGQPLERPHDEFDLLWLDAEGSLALFRQRMRDWGMPRGRFLLPPNPLQEIALDNPRDWEWIEGVIADYKPPLVVVDSLNGAHMSNENSNDKDGLKAVFKRLSALAQRHQIAVVLLHHLSKAAPGAARYPITLARVRGAGVNTQFCRSVLALGVPDESAPSQRRLDVIKANLCPRPPSLGYEITATGLVFGACPEPPTPRRAVDDALEFLETALANGPRLADELFQAARAEGIGSTVLREAKKNLNAKAQREGGKDGRWFWLRE